MKKKLGEKSGARGEVIPQALSKSLAEYNHEAGTPPSRTVVSPAEISDLLQSVFAAIQQWSRRNGYPDLPPFYIIEQMYVMLRAMFENESRDAR